MLFRSIASVPPRLSVSQITTLRSTFAEDVRDYANDPRVHDANGNGVSEPGEVKPLAAWGITALSCRYETHPTGIPFSPRGVVFQDASTRPSYDWIAPGK